jgi:hypothetical protein
MTVIVLRRQSQQVLSWYRLSNILSFVLLVCFLHTMTTTMFIVTAQDSSGSTGGSCAMDIWIFASFEGCQASDAPIANGKIYADGQCHTIETDLDTSNSNYQFFPGNYRVQCIDTNKIRFSDSACLDNVCTVTSLSTTSSTTTVCDRDNTSPASLYSRLSPPVYIVQDPSNASVGAFYTCLKLDGSDVTVTFVVFGDCTQSDCIITPTTPSTPTPTVPPITGTTAPTGSTPSTVSPTTAPPIIIVQPTTSAPITTTTTTTAAPIISTNVTTNAPISDTPSHAPSMIFVTPPSPIPIPVGTVPMNVPTPKPVVAPAIPTTTISSIPTPVTAPITKNGLINDIISVGIQLSPMNQMISSSSSSIEMWEDVTKLQIKSITESELNIVVFAMDISNITERIIDRNNNKNNNTSVSNRRQRLLQQNDTSDGTTIAIGTTITTALQIFFDLSMSYSIKAASSTDTTTPPTLATLFTNSFDTEQDRSNYLIKLVTNDNIFTSVRLVEVLYVHDNHGNTPTTTPAGVIVTPATDVTSNSTNNDSTNIALFAALSAGGLSLIVFAVLGFVYYQRHQKYHHRHPNSKSTNNSHDVVDIPSDNDDEYMNHNGPVGPLNFTKHLPNSPLSQQQRWTNEIVVDPSADDVSTLGGSVLAGYLDPTTTKNDATNNNHPVEDEPTASVNLDYDYNRNQYRSDVEDRSRTTNPTTFTNGTAFTASKLGMNQNASSGSNDNTILYSDDVSFEELYADMIDTNATTTMEDNNKGSNQVIMNHPRVQQLANIVKPYEIRAPPGKLGMVVDTPNGSVPIVRAIKPDSVLYGTVCIGDRLISVDHKDVTSMTALDVSNLISIKQNQHRLLVFCRIQQPQQQEQPMIITSGISPQNRMSGGQQQQPSPVATTTTSATSYQ